ncbi:hypothetical protein PMAYCL1PPCAC_27869, partial [Pristionchus mayeri]
QGRVTAASAATAASAVQRSQPLCIPNIEEMKIVADAVPFLEKIETVDGGKSNKAEKKKEKVARKEEGSFNCLRRGFLNKGGQSSRKYSLDSGKSAKKKNV